MTTTLIIVTLAVALAAAIRSTWSPCGLSMLSTITPFSERGKGHRYGVTAAWFISGAVVGGLTLGGVAALLAVGVRSLNLSATVVGIAALTAILVAMVSDAALARHRLPFHRRQVNERWLDAYRPWVYGAGFGWQIGCGLATYITTASVYLLVVLAALAGNPLVALAVGGWFGVIRGLAVLLTARLEDPGALLAFHRRFAAAGMWAHRLVLAVLTVSSVAIWAVLAWITGGLITGSAVVVGVAVVTGILRVASPAGADRDVCAVPTASGGRAEELGGDTATADRASDRVSAVG